MRLIDADALQREFMKYNDGKRSIFVDIAPTIQPERKKGKWIKARYVLTSNPAQYVWNCSECGKSVNGYSAVVLTDYCPQCGSYNGGAE